MADKKYSWHREYYDQALKKIVNSVGNQYDCIEIDQGQAYIGWLEFFSKEHPELYKKYEAAIVQVSMLWGNKDPKSMEEFKAAVKIEVDATKWAVDKYLQWQRQQKEAEALKGTQEALV